MTYITISTNGGSLQSKFDEFAEKYYNYLDDIQEKINNLEKKRDVNICNACEQINEYTKKIIDDLKESYTEEYALFDLYNEDNIKRFIERCSNKHNCDRNTEPHDEGIIETKPGKIFLQDKNERHSNVEESVQQSKVSQTADQVYPITNPNVSKNEGSKFIPKQHSSEPVSADSSTQSVYILDHLTGTQFHNKANSEPSELNVTKQTDVDSELEKNILDHNTIKNNLADSQNTDGNSAITQDPVVQNGDTDISDDISVVDTQFVPSVILHNGESVHQTTNSLDTNDIEPSQSDVDRISAMHSESDDAIVGRNISKDVTSNDKGNSLLSHVHEDAHEKVTRAQDVNRKSDDEEVSGGGLDDNDVVSGQDAGIKGTEELVALNVPHKNISAHGDNLNVNSTDPGIITVSKTLGSITNFSILPGKTKNNSVNCHLKYPADKSLPYYADTSFRF
ncbi:hypothetical protein PGO_003115 [Plasmodium gonderi]|uniref:Variable surface protein n=1 Tax=Plasmodium gonderi TaxID=77519 RepID=A0A1Y1JXD2_PLAGO|nr:hypothetical protein PGO_003115 [Plasmodium gonderi]GAW84464.1 hypothetical protein PGO_003115 [Plasmodium gonderi]